MTKQFNIAVNDMKDVLRHQPTKYQFIRPDYKLRPPAGVGVTIPSQLGDSGYVITAK